MAQSGIPVPVSNESRLAIFDDVYADVGDEQSHQLEPVDIQRAPEKSLRGAALGDSPSRLSSSTSWDPEPIQSKAQLSAARFSRR